MDWESLPGEEVFWTSHYGTIWLQYDELDEDGVALSNETRDFSSRLFADESEDMTWDEVTSDFDVRKCQVNIIRRDSRSGEILWER